jgi:hypothetical protein
MKLSDLPKTTKLKLGMYGVAGVGKTRSLLTIPDFARPIWIADFDFGAKSLLNSEHNDNIFIDTFSKLTEFNDTFDRLFSSFQIKQAEGMITPKTIVIDSWTSKDELFKLGIVQGVPRTHQQAAWGDLISKNLEFLVKLRSLPLHTVVIFHANALIDETVGILGYEPIAYGKNSGVPQKLPSSFDEFYFCNARKDKNETKYEWMTSKTDLWMARSRTKLPNSIPMDFKLVFDSYKITT